MKRSNRPDPTPAEAIRVGEELREAREALGVPLAELATTLRIRRVYLEALEEGRVRDIPAPAYVVGFARAYARAVGLDEETTARRLRDGAGVAAPHRKADLVFPEPVPERGVPAGAVMLAGAVLMVGAYVGWYHWSGSGERTVDTVPPPPPRLERLAETAGTLTLGDATTPAPTPPTSAAAATALPRPTATAGPAASVPPPPAPAQPAVAAVPAPATDPARTPTAPEARLLLRARTAEVWVQIRERAGGPVLVDRVLRPGESLEAPAGKPGLVLATGNAGALEVLIGAETTAIGLGPGPSVRRNVPLEPERLRSAAAAPATPASGTPGSATPVSSGPAPAAAARPATPQ